MLKPGKSYFRFFFASVSIALRLPDVKAGKFLFRPGQLGAHFLLL